jgi:GPH family glycoside/pentoside/hexuronide:cation symporter
MLVGQRAEVFPAAHAQRLSWATILAYASPAAGVGFGFLLMTLYLVHYATDVLLMAPAVIGALFALAKIWDAVADPIAGHLSDRTLARAGRRRSWIGVSALPLAVSFYLMWCPPAALGPAATAMWVGVALFAYSTLYTVFSMPHDALGAELTLDHHERTRLFGAKHLIATLGSLAAVGALQVLGQSAAPREAMVWVAGLGAAGTALLILAALPWLREPPEHQGRGGTHMLRAFADVARNPHARLLLIVFGIESLGSASIGLLTPYAAKYIVKQPEVMGPALLAYFLPNLVLPPLWVRLARSVGKKRVWLGAMAVMWVGYGGLLFLGEGDGWLMIVLGAIAGTGGSCGNVIAPSVKADVIDWDEHRTGERKEGAYFAVWAFVRKGATGLTAMLTGFGLQLAGFVPNVEQSEVARWTILGFFGGLPAVCYLIGTVLFARFRLDEAEHARIRRELDARAGGHTAVDALDRAVGR